MGSRAPPPGSHRCRSANQAFGRAWASSGIRKINPRIELIAPAVFRMIAPAPYANSPNTVAIAADSSTARSTPGWVSVVL